MGKKLTVSRTLPAKYGLCLRAVKERIRAAQVRAAFAASSELVLLYWDIGRSIAERQDREGWGAAVVPRLARDIGNAMPEVKGFSERNLNRMVAFWREYSALPPILPPPVALLESPSASPNTAKLTTPAIVPPVVAQLQPYLAQLPWVHHVLLMEQVKDLSARLWYMRQALEQGWSRNILLLKIRSRAHERAGKAVHNFAGTLPPAQ